MKKYIIPEIKITTFTAEDIMAASGINQAAQHVTEQMSNEGVKTVYATSWDDMLQ